MPVNIVEGPGRRTLIFPTVGPPPPRTPLAPTGVAVGDGIGSVRVTWDPPAPVADLVQSYRVLWAADQAGAPAALVTTGPELPVTAGEFVIAPLAEGTWWAQVQARNAAGWGDLSPWTNGYADDGQPTEAAPGPATNVTVLPNATGMTGTFQWPGAAYPPVTGAVLRVQGQADQVIPTTRSTFAVTGQAPGSYPWSLVIVNPVGESPAVTGVYSVTGTTQPPAPPAGLSAEPIFGAAWITISPSPSPSAIRYEWTCGTLSGSTLASSLRFLVSPLPSGMSHTVSAWAVDAQGRRSNVPATVQFFLTEDNTAVIEYRGVASSNNIPGLNTAQQNAIGQGKALRIVGDTLRMDGTFYWADKLTDLRFGSGTVLRQYGNPHGTIVRLGELGTQTWSITGGGERGDITLTLSNVTGLNVNDWVIADADLKYSHKDTYWSHTRQIKRITGNTIEVDKPFHRDREGKAGRVRKVTFARPARAQGGVVEHNNPATAKGHDLVQLIGARETVWSGLEVRNGPGTGLKTALGLRNRFESFHAHHLRNSPSQNQYGYGWSDEGDRETWVEEQFEEGRHAFSTDQLAHISTHPGNWGILTGRGECEDATVIVKVYRSICTGFADHEPGWGITFGGTVDSTGYIQSSFNAVGSATPTNDPTGGFWRSRGWRIHPTIGLRFTNINNGGAQRWYAALTIADLADKMKTQGFKAFSLAEAGELGPGLVTVGLQGVDDLNVADAVAAKQPVKISNLLIYGPVPNGIDMDSPYGTGERSLVLPGGVLRIERATVGISDASLLQGAASAQFVNCGTNMEG